MQLLYEAQDAIEARLMKNMLQQAGIETYIHGELLQGGIGDIQAFGIVKLMIDEHNYKTAREIIDEWNNAIIA